jgi:hypothetical protein
MKVLNCPNTGLTLLISFSLLLVPFGLINNYILQADHEHPIASQASQSIPDTFSTDITLANIEPAPVEILLQRLFFPDIQVSAGVMIEPSARPIGGAVADSSVTGVLDTTGDAAFDQFLLGVINGDGETITGVYVRGILSLRVIQQPFQDEAFVSNETGTATQFRTPALFGVVGLLAHNYLSGRHFLSLLPGHEIRLVYGDGNYRRYRVTGSTDFERLTRSDVLSDFRDLRTQAILTSRELFNRFYRGDNYLTLQTCLEGDGYSNWGVRMVSAVPMDFES